MGFLVGHHFVGLVRCLDLSGGFLSAQDSEEGSLLLLLTLSIFMVSACFQRAALLR